MGSEKQVWLEGQEQDVSAREYSGDGHDEFGKIYCMACYLECREAGGSKIDCKGAAQTNKAHVD